MYGQNLNFPLVPKPNYYCFHFLYRVAFQNKCQEEYLFLGPTKAY